MSDERPPRPEPLAIKPDSIPDKLKSRNQWVCWRYKWDTGRDEWTKAPVDANTNGDYASSTDDNTWTSFADALAYHKRIGTDTDGLGFVVHEGGLVVGLDLDDCQDSETSNREAWADDVLDAMPTYAEISPSGTGLRLFGVGLMPEDGNRADIEDAEGHIEMYEAGRYLTMTGHHVENTPEDVQQVKSEILNVHAEYIVDDGSDDSPDTEAGAGDSEDKNPTSDGPKTGLEDDELLEKAKNAKNGDSFSRLWHGDISGHESHSEADLALVNHLAFWTGGERGQIDRLFRQSGLYRDKWDRDDYRGWTIDKALSGRTDFYSPGSGPDAAVADGGAAAASASDGGSAVDETRSRPLAPQSVMAEAGLGEDDSITDLTDRQKAACVWELVVRNDDVHVRVRRDNGSLWAYDGGIWEPKGERALRHAGRKALGSMNYAANVLTELKAQARSDLRAEVEADEFGVPTGSVAVENGLVDLDAAANGDDARRDLRPDDYALAQLPVEYDPEAEYDEWAEYVEEWAEEGKAAALQEYVGYCLHIGALPIHRAILLVGQGSNGKGTFLHVVRNLLGQENTSSIELQTLANEKDAVADFYGSLANIDDDLSTRKLGQGKGMFKKLIAGDRVRARALYESGFEFEATGKHLYAANKVPKVDVPDDDEAFWRRWLLVEFPNFYPPAERDGDLRYDLTEDDATMSGVLNWAIEGWKRLLEQGYFTDEEQLAHDKRRRWQSWGDSVDEFISECVEHDDDAPRMTTGEAHARYEAWCDEQDGTDAMKQQPFTVRLKAENVGYGASIRMNGTTQRGYTSLGLSDDVPEIDTDPDNSTQERL